MKQDNFKAPPEPPIEKDDNNVYNFKCEKQHKDILEVQCQQCEFEAKYPSH